MAIQIPEQRFRWTTADLGFSSARHSLPERDQLRAMPADLLARMDSMGRGFAAANRHEILAPGEERPHVPALFCTAPVSRVLFRHTHVKDKRHARAALVQADSRVQPVIGGKTGQRYEHFQWLHCAPD